MIREYGLHSTYAPKSLVGGDIRVEKHTSHSEQRAGLLHLRTPHGPSTLACFSCDYMALRTPPYPTARYGLTKAPPPTSPPAGPDENLHGKQVGAAK